VSAPLRLKKSRSAPALLHFLAGLACATAYVSFALLLHQLVRHRQSWAPVVAVGACAFAPVATLTWHLYVWLRDAMGIPFVRDGGLVSASTLQGSSPHGLLVLAVGMHIRGFKVQHCQHS
jgi:hypothetical protein